MRLVHRCSFDFWSSTGNWAKSGGWVLFLKWAFFHAIWHQGVHDKMWPVTNSHSHGTSL